VVFRADGGRAAVAWNIDLAEVPGYLAYVSARDLASVELLDAGAGKKAVADFAATAAGAGFRVGDTKTARAKRTESAVYARKGFEAEARELARLVGAKEVGVLDWNTCCAISVALAR